MIDSICAVFNNVADHLYPVQLGLSADDAKFMWLSVLFADETGKL